MMIRIQNELARRYLQLGSDKDALQCIGDAVNRASRKPTAATVPLYSAARMMESDALLRQGRPDDALRALEDAANAAPDDPTIALAAAHMLFGLAAGGATVDTARVESAILWYDKVLRTQPRCPAVHARKAYLSLLLGRWDRAQAEAVTELTIEPRSVCALTVLGLCYLAGGDATNALVFFNKAIDIDPACAAAHNGRDLARGARAGGPPQ
jgi:tetratricopeptide (TPR) repeat protein